MNEETNSYSQIVRTSSILGGAQALTYLVGFARLKLVAVLLGPSGLGMMTLYASSLQLLGSVSSLGIGNSAVREIAEAHAEQNDLRVAFTAAILRRLCWITGLAGWLLAVVLAKPISGWLVGSTEHSGTIATLGVTLVVGSVTSGQLALLQGLRRIGDLARANVYGVLGSSLITIALIGYFRHDGIIPVLLATPLVTLACAHWYARRIELVSVMPSRTEAIRGARRMVTLGITLMSGSLLSACSDMFTRAVISQNLGAEAVGIYQAVWSISGMFAGFIISAMGTDFYPRLTSLIYDHPRSVRAVNEQMEVGILLALPGLLGTVAFAPSLMEIIYSKDFIAGAHLLPWMVLGVFGRVLSWPLGFIQLAKGASVHFFTTELVFNCAYVAMTYWFISSYGMIGAAYAFAAIYMLYTAGMIIVSRWLIDFAPSTALIRLSIVSALCIMANMLSQQVVSKGIFGTSLNIIIIMFGFIISGRGLASRLGPDHRLIKTVCRIPGGHLILFNRWFIKTND